MPPWPLDKQGIAELKPPVFEIGAGGAVGGSRAVDAQHCEAEALTEAQVDQGAPDEGGAGGQDDLGDAYLVVDEGVLVGLGCRLHAQVPDGRQVAHVVAVALDDESVVGGDGRVGVGLEGSASSAPAVADETPGRAILYLPQDVENGNAVSLAKTGAADGLADQGGVATHAQPEHILRQTVNVHQFFRRLDTLALNLWLTVGQ